MSMTNTTPIAGAALAVLQAEQDFTNTVAVRGSGASQLIDLLATQTTYETQILLRTVPVGVVPTP